jgi:hypothetical protein
VVAAMFIDDASAQWDGDDSQSKQQPHNSQHHALLTLRLIRPQKPRCARVAKTWLLQVQSVWLAQE